RGEADVVLASAYHPQGSVRNVPLVRAKISRWGNRLLSLSVNSELHTITCVVRGYTREVVQTLELVADDKELHLEIILKALLLGFRVAEIPADLAWRKTKRTDVRKPMSLGRLCKMITRHLFFNILLRPGTLVWIPLLILLGIIVVALAVLGMGYFEQL